MPGTILRLLANAILMKKCHPILCMGKSRHRRIKEAAQGHTGQWLAGLGLERRHPGSSPQPLSGTGLPGVRDGPVFPSHRSVRDSGAGVSSRGACVLVSGGKSQFHLWGFPRFRQPLPSLPWVSLLRGGCRAQNCAHFLQCLDPPGAVTGSAYPRLSQL